MYKHCDPGKWDIDTQIENLLREYDETSMPVPDIEYEPHILISKVRKHYMDYIIKILSHNYEANQKLLNKNIYLPSAIWRCAKTIEMKAAQMCMVVQLYRNNINSVIKDVKNDTKLGRLNKKLYECLHKAPENEKRTQTTLEVGTECCQCGVSAKKKRKKSVPSIVVQKDQSDSNAQNIPVNNIPVLINVETSQEPTATINVPPQTGSTENKGDELMLQLEKLFHSEKTDDDLFDATFMDNSTAEDSSKKLQDLTVMLEGSNDKVQESIIDNHSEQIKSLNQRLESLAGLFVNNETSKTQQTKSIKKNYASKWHCEEYFMKKDLFELLYQIGDINRKKLSRIKAKYLILFGDDDDDEEGIISPITDTKEFAESCKTRISEWVVHTLNPYYARGRIRGKALYKAVAKHLIDLVYKCKQYPSKYEVTSFVLDFLENHDMIRCEADFKEFRIENVNFVSNYNFIN